MQENVRMYIGEAGSSKYKPVRFQETGDVLKNIMIKKELKKIYNLSDKDIKDVGVCGENNIVIYNKKTFRKIVKDRSRRSGYIKICDFYYYIHLAEDGNLTIDIRDI